MNAERNIEAGIAAGKLALGGALAFLAWKLYSHFFRKQEIVRIDIPPAVPPVEQNAPDQPRPPEHATDVGGIPSGGLATGVVAHITNPPANGRVDRGLFRSTADVELEIINYLVDTEMVAIEIVADFHEFAGGERKGVRTLVTPFPIVGLGTTRFETPMDTGNTNGGLYELAQANAVVKVYVNNVLTHTTYFEVW